MRWQRYFNAGVSLITVNQNICTLCRLFVLVIKDPSLRNTLVSPGQDTHKGRCLLYSKTKWIIVIIGRQVLGGNTSEANIIVSCKHGHRFTFKAVCMWLNSIKKSTFRTAGVKQMANKEYYGLSWAVIILIIWSVLQESLQVFDGIPANISLHKTNGFNSAQVTFLKMEKDTQVLRAKLIQLQMIFSFFGAAVGWNPSTQLL